MSAAPLLEALRSGRTARFPIPPGAGPTVEVAPVAGHYRVKVHFPDRPAFVVFAADDGGEAALLAFLNQRAEWKVAPVYSPPDTLATVDPLTDSSVRVVAFRVVPGYHASEEGELRRLADGRFSLVIDAFEAHADPMGFPSGGLRRSTIDLEQARSTLLAWLNEPGCLVSVERVPAAPI